MWCANCHADVAAEVTADHRRIRCATCGSWIEATAGLRGCDRTREARELLERWSSHRIPDALDASPNPDQPAGGPAPETPSIPAAAGSPAKPVVRIDRPHFGGDPPHHYADGQKQHASGSPPLQGGAGGGKAESPGVFDSPPRPPLMKGGSDAGLKRGSDADARSVSQTEQSAGQSPPAEEPQTYLHTPHASGPPSPHFSRQAETTDERPRSNAAALTGQLLAYGGVLGLTVGTAMVVWGYFGGQENFAPTGWLIATLGQMLLFLGVVTLVSGGMEQTTEEVARRIDRLGEKLLRIEQASRDHALRGPNIPAERFAEGTRPSQTRESRETAAGP